MAGCIQAVRKMMQNNPSLTQKVSLSGHMPLHVAADSSTSPGQKEVCPVSREFNDEKLKHKYAVQLVKEVCSQVSNSPMTSSEILNLFLRHSILANAAKKRDS
ncbi:hypothetical protein Ancab_016574 [Ancistrocladus abbreviatus]